MSVRDSESIWSLNCPSWISCWMQGVRLSSVTAETVEIVERTIVEFVESTSNRGNGLLTVVEDRPTVAVHSV